MTGKDSDPLTALLAWIGHALLLLAAALAGIRALGLATDAAAGHAAVLGGVSVALVIAARLLRHRSPNRLIPVTCGLGVAVMTMLPAATTLTSLDAVAITCAVYAGWIWWKLPRAC